MSFGSAIGAIISLKNNKRNAKRKHGNLPGESSKDNGIKSHRAPSIEELEHLKLKLRKEHKLRQVKVICISTVLLIIICAVFYYIFS